MHPWLEAWLRSNYLRSGVTMADLIACYRSSQHEEPALRALHVHALHGKTAQARTAARLAIAVLTGAEDETVN